MGNGLTGAAAGSGTGPADASAPARPATSSRSARRLAVLVCAAALAGTAGCSVMAENAADTTNASGSPSARSSAASSSSDPGCVAAIKAVSTNGPRIVADASAAKKAVDKAEIQFVVVALDLAADAADAPQAKQSIQTLANAYLTFEDSWTDLAAPPLGTVLADTDALESVCG